MQQQHGLAAGIAIVSSAAEASFKKAMQAAEEAADLCHPGEEGDGLLDMTVGKEHTDGRCCFLQTGYDYAKDGRGKKIGQGQFILYNDAEDDTEEAVLAFMGLPYFPWAGTSYAKDIWNLS